MGFDKYRVSGIHLYSIIWNGFTPLKVPCTPPIQCSFPPADPWQPLIFFASLFLPFPEFYIIRVINCVVFSHCLLSFNNTYLRFLWLESSFLFFTEQHTYSTVCSSILILKDLLVANSWKLWIKHL